MSLKIKRRKLIIQPLLKFVVFVILFVFTNASHAHALGENYLWINIENDQLVGKFEINNKDIAKFLEIEIDQDKPISQQNSVAVLNYLKQNFQLSDSLGLLEISFGSASHYEEGSSYVVFPFNSRHPESDRLNISNTVFLKPGVDNFDHLHRSLLVYEYNRPAAVEFGTENVAFVFSFRQTEHELNLKNPSKILKWQDSLWQGVLHIWYGLDHMIFLMLCLVITVIKPVANRWVAVEKPLQIIWRTFLIITVFTVAHSITLTLGTLGIVQFNASFVEIIIAFSILIIAISNLVPRISSHSLLIIFAFGLFHGLGFSSVLSDLQFRTIKIDRILLNFNLGVELGQLAVVLAVVPILYFFRRSKFYIPLFVLPLSIVSILIASFWLYERTLILLS